jgi:predicted MFS family arabinose efflux permease
MEIDGNRVIRILITSDFLLQWGWGLIGPIFAIFLIQKIQGGSLATVGFIAATYWMTKSISQPFIAYFLDLKKGEKDDFKFLIGGMYVANLIPLGYLFSTQIWHIFLLEIIRGFAMACVVPSWSAIFTRHIKKGWEAFSWSIESTSIGFAIGFSGFFSGILATVLGFKILFILVTIFGLISSSVLFSIRNWIYPRPRFAQPALPKEKI